MNILERKKWGFDCIIMSDWESTYNAVPVANAGLDLEMPFGKVMSKENSRGRYQGRHGEKFPP